MSDLNTALSEAGESEGLYLAEQTCSVTGQDSEAHTEPRTPAMRPETLSSSERRSEIRLKLTMLTRLTRRPNIGTET